MEVMAHTEFNFDSASNSPYATAPSSPRAFGCYYTSAPTTPSRAAAFYDHYHSSAASGSASPVFSYDWLSAPGTPKSEQYESDNEQKVEEDAEDFAFEFSGQLVMGVDDALTATADELFEAGKIRPLKPPSQLQNSGVNKVLSPRGREQGVRGSELGGSEREARSLSPLRAAPSLESSCSKKGSKKWRLKDFFLFRSVSEGRVTSDKDPIRKYTTMSPVSEAMLSRKLITEDVKTSSFRSTGSVSGRSRRGISREGSGSTGTTSRRGSVSPHEMHYTANRAMSEELRKKTYLPYRQGLLGCLGFSNPALQRLLK